MPFVAGSGGTLTAMQTLLNNFWSVVTALFNGVGNVVSAITSNPILLIPSAIALGYAIVKIFRRFIVAI